MTGNSLQLNIIHSTRILLNYKNDWELTSTYYYTQHKNFTKEIIKMTGNSLQLTIMHSTRILLNYKNDCEHTYISLLSKL